ncbi:MAG: hypothetical protein L3K18_09690 [Thermoplasmata archaeon]|nr:hypothetical protein [Thermoplasmata archaeon]
MFPGSTGYITPTKFSGNIQEAPVCSVAIRELNGTAATVTLYGPDGQTRLDVAALGQRWRRNKRVWYFTATGNGAELLFDISSEGEFEDPSYLTAVAGTVNATIVGSTAGALLGSGLALEAGGNLATMTANQVGHSYIWDTILAGSPLNLTLDGALHDTELSLLMPGGGFMIDGNLQTTQTTMPAGPRIRKVAASMINTHPGGSYVADPLTTWLYSKQVTAADHGHGDGMWLAYSSPPAMPSGSNFNAGVVSGYKQAGTVTYKAASTAPGSDGDGDGNRISTSDILLTFGMELHVQYKLNAGDSVDCRVHMWDQPFL